MALTTKAKKTAKTKERRIVQITTQEPPIDHASPPVNERMFAPSGAELPKAWIKQSKPILHCPRCMRRLLDTMTQAVVCESSRSDVAWFRCKACGHRFKLGVKLA